MKKSRVRFVVKGLNQERAFTSLSKLVRIFKINRTDKHICELEILPKDEKQTRKFLQDNNFEIVSVQAQGAHASLKRFLSCYGLIVALILSVSAYFLQKGFVWQIKVFGNEKLGAYEITRMVEQNLSSRQIAKIDTKKLEIVLKENFKQISSVSVAIVGQSVVVNINEAVLPDEMTGDFKPLVCEYDCKITEIELIQGTINVKLGDIVRKGEVLVEPYIIDSEGQSRPVKPIANIKAEVWLTGISEHSDSYYRTTRTGRVIEQSKALLFGIELYKNSKQIPFKQYEVEEQTKALSYILLPIKIKKTKIYETKTELIEQTFEEVKDEIIQASREKALQNAQDCEIIKESFSIVETAGVHIVTYLVTASRYILGGS